MIMEPMEVTEEDYAMLADWFDNNEPKEEEE